MRSLRIGIVLRGLLVEERLFDHQRPVTLGQSLRCALSVPTDGMPREHTLFTIDQGRFVLHLTPGMETRLSGVSDGVLGPGARGRIVLGDASILFQEVATPPPAPRPRLPASIRGTLGDRIDRRLAAILGASLLAHVGIAAYAWSTDRELPPPGGPTAALDYRQDSYDITLPDLTAPPAPQPGVAAPATPVQTPAPIVHPTRIAPSPSHPPALGDADALRMASILTGADETPRGTGAMHARQPGADLDRQLEDASHHTVTIGGSDHASRTGREHIGTDPQTPLVGDPALAHTEHRAEHPVRISLSPVHTDQPTTLTPDGVLDKIRGAYLTGLERCYRKGLAGDAQLAGKVSLRFTVDRHGEVTEPQASGVSDPVDACIAAQMTSWHFPFPRDQDGDPTDVSFHVVLALQPS